MTLDLPRITELVAHAVAMAVAIRRARPGKPSFLPGAKPLAWFLGASLASDVVRWAIQFFVLQRYPRPFAGMSRVLFHVDQAGFVGWNAGLIMLTLAAFTPTGTTTDIRRYAVRIIAAWSAVFGLLVGSYPEMRGERLGHAYTALHALTVIAAVSIAARAWTRDAWFNATTRAASLLVAGDVATLFGPYLGEPFRYWSTAQIISAGVYGLLAWELRASRLAYP